MVFEPKKEHQFQVSTIGLSVRPIGMNLLREKMVLLLKNLAMWNVFFKGIPQLVAVGNEK